MALTKVYNRMQAGEVFNVFDYGAVLPIRQHLDLPLIWKLLPEQETAFVFLGSSFDNTVRPWTVQAIKEINDGTNRTHRTG